MQCKSCHTKEILELCLAIAYMQAELENLPLTLPQAVIWLLPSDSGLYMQRHGPDVPQACHPNSLQGFNVSKAWHPNSLQGLKFRLRFVVCPHPFSGKGLPCCHSHFLPYAQDHGVDTSQVTRTVRYLMCH